MTTMELERNNISRVSADKVRSNPAEYGSTPQQAETISTKYVYYAPGQINVTVT